MEKESARERKVSSHCLSNQGDIVWRLKLLDCIGAHLCVTECH